LKSKTSGFGFIERQYDGFAHNYRADAQEIIDALFVCFAKILAMTR
jgi:hypothetical protein